MRLRALALTVALTAALAGCGGGAGATSASEPAGTAAGPAASPKPASPKPATAKAAPVAAFPQRAFLAGGGTLTVRSAPRNGASVVASLPPVTSLGSKRVLLAVAAEGDWVQVALPVRPNGTTGWVPAKQLQLEPAGMRVTVDLAARRLRLYRGDTVVADSRVGIGSRANPTPEGDFYVTDRVKPRAAGGPYGAFALGLSAHSPTLTEFAGADGQVAVHGTNDAASIGAAVSHGCVRVPDDVARLLAQVPLGTPVSIT